MQEDIKITYAKEKKKGAVLKVIGVGGGGGNAINRMIEEGMQGVEFVAINTDVQDLSNIKPSAISLQIGEKITRGLGVGSNAELGMQAALENTEAIIEVLEGAHMAFITAGMGGGTGIGASQVIANHASSMGILTVAIVTKPFEFEGSHRMQVAETGIKSLMESVDALLVIPNQKLFEIEDANISYKDAYKKVDEILLKAVRGISDIINNAGYQNVDFADVKACMSEKGRTLMGTGEAKGENRAEEAVKKALTSPLLDNVSIEGATGILYNITAASDLSLREIGVIAEMIKNHASDSVVRGNELNSIRVSHNVWLGAVDERIAFIGREQNFNNNCTLAEDGLVIDGSDFVVFPGFVDPHTHLPFAHTRQDEFREKLQGVSYQEIAARGGGIKGTVRKTREIDANELIRQCEGRLDHILTAGTTTLEAKSGYGLDLDTEIKQLEVIKGLNAIHPIDIASTFMGAHEIPEEYKDGNKEFLDYLVEKVVPVVKERELAEFVDIFCENGVFTYEEAEYYFDKIEPYGFKIKLHADEFSSNNAALLAVKKKAVSAEHLIAMTDEEIDAISASDTACVFLPGVSFFLKLGKYAPIRKVIEKNGIVTLGTDFNPGSSMVSSQLFCFHLGIFNMGLTIEEAINTITINAAYSIDRHDNDFSPRDE